jgi:hypothetical protein
MYRRIRPLLAALGLVSLLVTLAEPAFADHKKIICVKNPRGGQTCTVVVIHDPPPGRGGGGGDQGAGTCFYTAANRELPCHNWQGWWDASLQCYVRLDNPQPPLSDPVWRGHADGAIYTCGLPECPDSFCYRAVWLAQPPPGMGPSPLDLARQALASLTIPVPSTGRYPAGRLKDGRPYTVVRAYTWYWTDPAKYKPLTARAAAGPVWAQVTVTPATLSFTPGDGSATVSCAGPGSPWTPSDGVWARSPSGCDYRYAHSSIHRPRGMVTATYSITWQISWVGSGGTSGTLAALTTTASSTFAVAEAESIVVR